MAAAPAQDDPRIGSILVERYKILERLSSGAMGVVYRAERLKLGRIVAIKFLHSAFAFSSDFTKRFDLEARTMSRLEHPHCVSVIDFGMADAPFIVMDFVTGTTLKEVIAEGPQPPVRALAIVRQILAGLQHAHEKGIIHRDIKPANVMLTQATGTGDHVRILDFGLAKLVDAEQSVSSVVVGTPSYMSPEQAGAKKVDARSDIYATSVLLYELLTGEKPFDSEQALQLIRMHIEKPPPTLAEKLPGAGFSDELEAAVKRGLAKSPSDRFQTPEEFAAALEATPEAQPSVRAATARPPTAPAGRLPTAGTYSRAGTVRIGPGGRPLTPLPVAAAPPPARSSWLGWLLALALVVVGGYTWNRLGRPGLPGRAATPKTSAAQPPVTLAGARSLIASGDREAALRLLNELYRKSPRDGEVLFLMGKLYFQKGWCPEAISAYLKTVDADAGYKANATLNQQVIDCLGDARTRDTAQKLLRNKLGAAALPYLRVASRSGRTAEIRRLATQLVKDIGAETTPR